MRCFRKLAPLLILTDFRLLLDLTANLAPLGIREPLLGEEGLIPIREGELVPAIHTGQLFVWHGHN